jgi:hypothetical protein
MSEGPDRPLVLDFGMQDTEFYLAWGASVLAFEANGQLVEHNRCRFHEAIAAGHLEIVSGAIVPPDFDGEAQTFYLDSQKSICPSTWTARRASAERPLRNGPSATPAWARASPRSPCRRSS